METRSRKRPARRTRIAGRNRSRARLAARNGNGSRRRRARLGKRLELSKPALASVGRTNGDRERRTPEMDRSDPQFRAALKDFTAATRLFRKESYAKAQGLFEKVVSSPAHELAERARVHLALCQQRRARSAPAPKNPEEYYNVGVAELNARHLELAIEHLSKADKTAPNREHVKYALAAAHALQGNTDIAIEHLKVAIALRSGNRFLARSDEDFQPVASDPRFKRLVSSGDGLNSGSAS